MKMGRHTPALLAWLGVAAPALAAEPASVPTPALKAGDTWTYDSVIENGTTGFAEGRYDARIEDVRDDGVILGIKRPS